MHVRIKRLQGVPFCVASSRLLDPLESDMSHQIFRGENCVVCATVAGAALPRSGHSTPPNATVCRQIDLSISRQRIVWQVYKAETLLRGDWTRQFRRDRETLCSMCHPCTLRSPAQVPRAAGSPTDTSIQPRMEAEKEMRREPGGPNRCMIRRGGPRVVYWSEQRTACAYSLFRGAPPRPNALERWSTPPRAEDRGELGICVIRSPLALRTCANGCQRLPIISTVCS